MAANLQVVIILISDALFNVDWSKEASRCYLWRDTLRKLMLSTAAL
jgi:hypothetical protein